MFEEFLNSKQLEAVECIDCPLLVLAGAGSGKTRVITFKIAYLLETGFAPPWRILAMTFTNKASKEMKERAGKLVLSGADRLKMGTFHSICSWILRREAHRINGYNENYSIYDRNDSSALIKKILISRGLEKTLRPDAVLRIISGMKNSMITTDEAKRTTSDFREEIIAEVYKEYQKALKISVAFDFDDLLTETLLLLCQNIDVYNLYSNMFSYILVDEYQDTNSVQHQILKKLSGKRNGICVVGDDDQSIYSWRGARIENMLEFSKDFPGTRIINLEQNYRSTRNILKSASSLVGFNSRRHVKKLWTEKDKGNPVIVQRLPDSAAEANWVMDRVLEIKEWKNIALGNMVVLYRTNAQSREFESTARRKNIPYEIVGSLRFFERQEIKDIIAYQRLVINPDDRVSLERVLNRPSRGIGDKSKQILFEKLKTFPRSNHFDILKKASGIKGLLRKAAMSIEKFGKILSEAADMAEKDDSTAEEVTRFLIDSTGFEEQYKTGLIEDDSRLRNIGEYMGMVKEFDARNSEAGLAAFLAEICLLTGVDEYSAEIDKLPLMTLHCAKGLEFDTVFVTGLEEGLLPLERTGFGSVSDIEEERRLLYVGMTRAKERLVLTLALRRNRYGRSSYGKASRFLEEIEEHSVSSNQLSENNTPRLSMDKGYKKGDIIGHPRYGKGLVLKAGKAGEEWELEIDFGGDESKTFITGYVPITLISRKG